MIIDASSDEINMEKRVDVELDVEILSIDPFIIICPCKMMTKSEQHYIIKESCHRLSETPLILCIKYV